MRTAFSLQSSAFSKKIISVLLATLTTLPSTLYAVPSTYAQTASSSATPRTTQNSTSTKKNVVKNFKINLSEYSSFGTNCDKKPQGDANCDGIINGFDLSIWEIEFNSNNPPKKADFNNDGAVTIVDYGIWRNTSFPQKTTQNILKSFLSLISDPSAQRQASLKSLILNLKSLIITNIYAQESSSGGGEVNSSSAFTSESGNLVINTLNGGNSQQINFDQTGNPQTSSFYNGNGDSYAEVAFTSSGDTIIATQESGIPVTISKTASGPIIENFKNPDGSPLAIKSWPSQESYDSNQPPLAVTIPGQGGTREVLNLQPNGDGIVEKLDAGGNILTRTQLRANGTTVTEDIKSGLIVQSNSEAKLTNLSMKNNIGGNTQYMFYDGSLYAIVQTDSGNNAYVSKPLDSTGSSWNYETLVEGVKREEKTVSNPITEAKTNTPDPQSLIQYINYYKQSSPSSDITFTDGFNSTTSSMSNIINKANSTLAISQTQAPAVLGIVKEANAQVNPVQRDPNSNTGGVWTEDKYTLADGSVVQINSNGTGTQVTIHNGPGATIANPVNGGAEISVGRPDFGAMTGSSNQNAQAAAAGAWASALAAGKDTEQARAEAVTAAAQTTSNTTQPAAAQPATASKPADFATDAKTPTSSQISGVLSQALNDALTAAQNHPGSLAEKSLEAKATYERSFASEYSERFSGPLELDTQATSRMNTEAINVAVHTYATTTHPDIMTPEGLVNYAAWNSRGYKEEALGALGLRDVDPSTLSAPGAYAPNTGQASGNTGSQPAAAPAAAAAVAPGIGAPQSGYIGNTGVYSQVTQNLGNGTFISEIKTGPGGETIATQIHNPTLGSSTWTDERGSTYTQGGAVTAYTPTNNTFAPSGTTYALDTAGNIVAVGYGTQVDANGRVSEGRSIEGAELGYARDQLSRQDSETRNTTGVSTGIDFANADSTCFLAGTLISTPNGKKAIETLSPGDKIYSYNEKTGQKQTSDFRELDINFVDEYLIINNKIRTTIYHPFYVIKNNKLVTLRADELKFSDILQNESGNHVPIYSTEKIRAPRTTVYNLMNVSPNNNFFAENILVHNYDWSPPDMDADPNQTGATADDPGSFFSENLSHPDTARGGGDGGNDLSGDNPTSGGELGGTAGGGNSDLGRDSQGDGWGSSSSNDTPSGETTSSDTSTSDQGGSPGDSSTW